MMKVLILLCLVVAALTKTKYSKDYLVEAQRAFLEMQNHYQDIGLDNETIKQRFGNFLVNYQRFIDSKKWSGRTFETALNSIELLDDVELSEMFGVRHDRDKRDAGRNPKFAYENNDKANLNDMVMPIAGRGHPHEKIARYVGAFLDESKHYSQDVLDECQELKDEGAQEVSKTCLKSPSKCPEIVLNRRCFYNGNGIPDEFSDWSELSYIQSLLQYRAGSTLPAGWAHTASQIADLYQQIYTGAPTTNRADLVSIKHMLNCVYRYSGLERGSPQAGFQYMSENIVMPKDPTYKLNEYKVLVNTRIWYRFQYIWSQAKFGKDATFCTNSTGFDPQFNAIPDVTFESGKAYVQFADDTPTKVWGSGSEELVRGELIAKPLLYKKGPLAVMMQACYDLFLVSSGIFNVDCANSDLNYLPQWVTLATYGPTWFGVVFVKFKHSDETILADITKVSRIKEFTFIWNSFVVPRVAPYNNTLECKEGGVTTNAGVCYCPNGYHGTDCSLTCPLICQNGGQLSHYGCKCNCPSSHYGPNCTQECNCGKTGTCDDSGNCICQRQMSWGATCQHDCVCQNSGYCHNDGTCECVAGFSGNDCSDPCTKQCTAPHVCRYSNKPTDAGTKLGESCDCPRGLYGSKCEMRVVCDKDIGSVQECTRYQRRHRCFNAGAMKLCPVSCGHCLTLNQVTGVDS